MLRNILNRLYKTTLKMVRVVVVRLCFHTVSNHSVIVSVSNAGVTQRPPRSTTGNSVPVTILPAHNVTSRCVCEHASMQEQRRFATSCRQSPLKISAQRSSVGRYVLGRRRFVTASTNDEKHRNAAEKGKRGVILLCVATASLPTKQHLENFHLPATITPVYSFPTFR